MMDAQTARGFFGKTGIERLSTFPRRLLGQLASGERGVGLLAGLVRDT